MGVRVGITAVGQLPQAGADCDAALWSSGITQNIVFLALLLRRLPQVERAALVACPAGADLQPLAGRFGLECVDESACATHLDLVVELGARASTAAMTAFREAGGKLVSYVAGNVMAMNFEQLACGVAHGDMMSDVAFDAVWITPQHWRMNASYAATTRSGHVAMAPHIWSPDVWAQAVERNADAAGRQRPPQGQGARVGVFDPNVNVLKTFHLPLLVCEEAERESPGAIARVLLFGAVHLKGLAHVEEFIAATDLGRTGRVFVEHRAPLPEVLGRHVDIVVTHQWENDLNYLYWDVLHAGFPLVHNAGPIADAGYHYNDFDPQSGGGALLKAIKEHGQDRATARAKEMDAIWRHHIDNPTNQHAYSALICDVMGRA